MLVANSEYITVDESTATYPSSTDTISSNSLTMITETYEVNTSDSYVNYVVDLMSDQHITVYHSESFEESIELSCTTSSLSTLDYTLVQYQSQIIPDWVNIDFSTGKLYGNAPYMTSSTQYIFAIDITGDDFDGTKQKVIYLDVNLAVSGDVEVSKLTSQIASVVSVGIIAVVAISNVSTLGSVWSIINQLQMLILLLFVPTFIGKDVRDHIRRQSFAIFSFNFFSLNKIVGVKYALEYFGGEINTDKSHDRAMREIGLDSESVVSNLLSLAFMLV